MRTSSLIAMAPLVLLPATTAPAQGLEVSPRTVAGDFRPSLGAFDTVTLLNKTADVLRVDSITIRFLDGGADPRPADFTACKACPPDTIGAYVYGGWLYGPTLAQSLRYLRDSLFLIQDRHGVPVTLSLSPGASAPFALFHPVNCPVCGREPGYPGATRYAFTFIASEGSRAVLNLDLNPPSGLVRRETSPGIAVPGVARDAAGRSNHGDGRAIRFRKLSR